ncbi:MAG: adenylyltransferase/cytidyltransferase family protein [Desulfamplus sp.]|nr:adenylyltransferase/cytidyltransferase family protein [Desulfamplus sp.]
MDFKKSHKIKTINEIAALLQSRGKQRLVYCHGVFDLLHIGHLRHFQQAKAQGDILVVSLTPDRWVDKGPHRPAFPEQLRAEALASLSCVDWVFINNWPTAVESIKLLGPDFYAKGTEFEEIISDRTGKIGLEKEAVESVGAKLIFTKDIVFSSSNLINRYFSNHPREVREYLNLLRSRRSLEDLLGILDAMAGLKVLVIGDTILDEYQYCEPIGKSSKDPVLAVRHQTTDIYAGGILAIANHVAQFAGQVELLTVLGEDESHEDFVRSSLSPRVRPFFFYQRGTPTLTKRRYVDGYTQNKLFEVYVMNDNGLDAARDQYLRSHLGDVVQDYDLVLAGDFGHGAVSQSTADLLADSAPFLALMTQANAGNRGFHTFTRYKRADYVCVAEHEMRLEFRQANGEITALIPDAASRMQSRLFTVTRGRRGCSVYDDQGSLVEIPAFAAKVVDRVGAGDAFLALTSLAAFLHAPPEVVGFLGNCIGSLAVEVVGNKKSIDRQSVEKLITSLMK